MLLLVAATVQCTPDSPTGEDPDPHDFSLTLRLGDVVIPDGGTLDGAPEPNRIVVESVRLPSLEDHLLVQDLLVTVEADGPDAVTLTSTSSTLGEGSPQFVMTSEGITPFDEVPVSVSVDLEGYFSGEPTGYRSTVHLAGEYLAADDAGAPLDEGSISHALVRFTGEAEVGDPAAREVEPLGTVEGPLVRDEAAPVAFDPADVDHDLAGGAPATLRGRLQMDLGPTSGLHLPVSATVSLRALRD